MGDYMRRLDDLLYELGEEVPAECSRNYTINGVKYRIDLTVENAKNFDEAMREWTRISTPITASSRTQVYQKQADKKG